MVRYYVILCGKGVLLYDARGLSPGNRGAAPAAGTLIARHSAGEPGPVPSPGGEVRPCTGTQGATMGHPGANAAGGHAGKKHRGGHTHTYIYIYLFITLF